MRGASSFDLWLGVVGHRPDKLADPEQLAQDLGRRFLALQSELSKAGVRGHLCTSMAAGTDLLAVEAATRAGIAGVELWIPGGLPEFRKEVAEAGDLWAERFDAAVRLATRIVEVPILAPGQGYAEVAESILQRCDVLLAVWDGQPGRGEGGTAHSVDVAQTRGIPVLWLRPLVDSQPVLLNSPNHLSSELSALLHAIKEACRA